MFKKHTAKWSAWQAASNNRRIFSAMIIVVIMTVIAKMAVVIKELMVADQFGTSEMVDAFLFAYLLPAFSINVLSSSFSSAMMPTYIRTRDNKGKELADKLFSSLMLIGILFLIFSAILLAVFAPTILSLLGTGFSQKTMSMTHELFYWLLPIVVLTGWAKLYSTIINAGESFFAVALTPVITPICTVIALLFMTEQWGIFSLVAGAVLGAGIELFILAMVSVHKNIPLLPRWHGMTEDLNTVIGQYTPMVAGAFLMSGTALVDQAMAAMLDSGSVATLNYANKVISMILGIGSMALGTAVLPHFSRLVAQHDWGGIRHIFKTYVWLIVFISLPITILLFIFSPQITELLFERGAFTSTDTIVVAQVQAFYVLQIPFYLLGILGVKLVSSIAKNKILMRISGINLVINIFGNYVLMGFFGVAGIALSTSIVYILSMGMIFYSIKKNI